MFSAQVGGVYTITTSSYGQRADTFLALFDTDGTTLLVGNDDFEGTTDFSSQIVWHAPADGVYYIRVTNRAGLDGCYTDYSLWLGGDVYQLYVPLVFNEDISEPALAAGARQEGDGGSVFNVLGIITHMCSDGYEIDDTWEDAQLIESGIPQLHSFDSDPVLYAADKDFVWFEITDTDVALGKSAFFSTPVVTNTATLLEIYDETGDALGISGLGSLMWHPTAAGTYYLSVSPLSTTFGCADTVGYHLVANILETKSLYLPLTLQD
jgi:hypothetical protein